MPLRPLQPRTQPLPAASAPRPINSGQTTALTPMGNYRYAVTPLQRRAAGSVGKALPEPLRQGIAALSGHDLGDVAVHYRSPLPASMDAEACAQGGEIHLAPGQERHLPHEAWHIVQQRQQRVKPTLNVGGQAVNDSPALEREADHMGSRALQAAPAASAVPAPAAVPPANPAGCGGASALQRVKRGPKVPATPEWEQLLASVNAHAVKVKGALDDDDDLALLQEYVDDADAASGAARNFDKRAAKLPPRPQGLRPPRNATSKDLVKRRLDESKYREFYVERRDRQVADLYKTLAALKKTFPAHAGGFGAKGRAHAMDGVAVTAQGSPVTAGRQVDNSFLADIELDGTALTATSQVEKETLTVASEKAGPAIVQGLPRNTGQPVPAGLLTDTDSKIAPLGGGAEWHKQFTATPVGRDRGAGQFANMANTNATGYAWMSAVPGWQNQRWEWLHVRGAGLGGATDGTNLVVGTRDANTQMIPFESNVRLLATVVGSNPNYQDLDVKWSVGGQSGSAPHKVDTIRMEWILRRSGMAGGGVPEPRGKADFKPLKTDANISKTEVDKLESALQTVRATL